MTAGGKLQPKGFTLLEILVVVAIIAAVATIVFVALNPAEKFAQARDTARWEDVESIAHAAHLYSIDNPNATIPGIDGTLRMIGTATTGCSLTCDGLDIAYRQDDFFSIPEAHAAVGGWVSPDTFTDAGSQWTTEANAIDGNTATYASNTFGSAGLGQFLEVQFTTPILSDRLRIIADYLDAHINYVDVDVYVDGAWFDAFQGGDEETWNVKWAEVTFPLGTVERARFRWNYAVAGYHYWLYDMEFYEAAADPELPSCGASSASSIGESFATLSTTIGADGGDPVEYRFQYGTTPSYGSATAWTGDYVSFETVQSALTGLNGFTNYFYRAELRNSVGTTNCSQQSFTTSGGGEGWTPAMSTSSSSWLDQPNSRDGSTATYARLYHNIGQAQWSDYLTFDFADIYYDSLRFYALGGSLVSTIDVDIQIGGVWTDLYQGGFANRSWVTVPFAETIVEAARVRFFATNINTGFFWEINELQLYETTASGDLEVTTESCVDIADDLARYLPDLPTDPYNGSQERTQYAIVREFGSKRITVKACSAELGQTIQASR